MRSGLYAICDEATRGSVYDINWLSRHAATPRSRARLLIGGAPVATRAVANMRNGVFAVFAGIAIWLVVAVAVVLL